MATAQETCFPDAIPEGARKNLTNAEGENYPLGIWVPTWAAAELTSAIVEILVGERIGYNIRTAGGFSTLSQFYAITGCQSPTVIGDRGCGPDGPDRTYYHVSVEGWTLGYAAAWGEIQASYPRTAPKNLGSSGYMGHTGQYLASEIIDVAVQTDGLALDFYRSYNSSWHRPSRYFDPISSMNLSELKSCDETLLWDSALIQRYAVMTGDWDGTENTSGVVHGKCFHGRFWFSPSCRHNSSLCIVFVTAGPGYDLEVFMQRATFYNMPLASTVAKDWAFSSFPRKMTGVLFYWWQPDPTFLKLGGKRLLYPSLQNREAARNGDFREEAAGIFIDKYASFDLIELAPDVEELVKAFVIDIKVVSDLMSAQIDSQSSPKEVACRWLLANPRAWEEWVPDVTKCFSRFGLHNTHTQQFVNSRGNLINLTCNPCPSGTFSSPLRDDKGFTYVCKPCAPGSAQAAAASLECEPCPRGESQEASGGAFCQRCPRGTYQDANGQRSCLACPTGTTTPGLASMSVTECVCAAGAIEEDGKCRLCGLGMFCPKGSTVALLLNHSSGIEDELPYLQPGFTSSPSSPLKIYKCPQEFCPGGMPGDCSGDRVGLTCGGCAVGTYPSVVGSCSSCQDENLPLWTACFLVLGVAFLVVYYYLTSQSYNPQASVSTVVLCVVGLAFNMFQNLAVISATPTAWPPLLTDTIRTGRILTLNVEAFGLSCIFAGPGSVLLKYLAQVVAFPVVICVILLVFVFTRLLSKMLNSTPWGGQLAITWTWHGTVSLIGKFCHCTFPTMVNISLIPFMCYAHPDGEESLVKFTETFCWEGGDHLLMMVAGAILAGLSLAFFSLCFWAAWNVADWNPRSQAACKFMVEDFRPDMLWFGLVTLCRGLLLSLPAVMASNEATLQLVLLHSVMIASLVFQSSFQPWKAPALNLFDTLSQCMFVTLLGVGLGGLTDNGATTNDQLQQVGSIICILLLIFFGALLVAFTLAFTFDKLLNRGIGKGLINLGFVPSPKVVFFLLRQLAKSVEENKWQKPTVAKAMSSLGTRDLREVLAALAILQLEVGLEQAAVTRPGRSSMDSMLSSKSQFAGALSAARLRVRVFEGQSALTKRRVSRRAYRTMEELKDTSGDSDSGSEEAPTESVEVKIVDDQSNLSHSSKASFDDPMVEFHI